MKRTISTFSRCAFFVLLFVVLLGPLCSAHATDWGFTLIGHPNVEKNPDLEEPSEEPPETLQMTGAGAFNPDQGTASGGGSFTVFNAFDPLDMAIGGPTFYGTWTVTEFMSWKPEGDPEVEPKRGPQGGTLKVRISMVFKVGVKPEFRGLQLDGVVLTLSGEGINVDVPGTTEIFGSNHTGLVAFHPKKP